MSGILTLCEAGEASALDFESCLLLDQLVYD